MGGKRRPSGAQIDLEIAIELSPGRWLRGFDSEWKPVVGGMQRAMWLQCREDASWALSVARRSGGYLGAKSHWRVK